MGDDQRPTLTVTDPKPGANYSLSRILIGMTDAYTGIDPETLTVTADFAIDGIAPGTNLAARFEPLPGSRWQLKLARPISDLKHGTLTVSVKDRQGNIRCTKRQFQVR